MLKRINQTDMSPSTMAYRLDGNLDAVMFQTIGREITSSVETNGDVNVLLEIGKIDTADAAGLVKTLKATGRTAKHINRLAWVTDEPKLSAVGKIASVLPGVDVEHFNTADQVDAWRWVATGEMPSA